MLKLSKKSKEVIDRLTQEDIEKFPDDGEKAVFIKPMNDKEYDKYQREHVEGWREVLDRFKL